MAQRITWAVVAQLHEFLAVTHVVRQRYAAALQTARAWQGERRDRMAARQHHELAGCIDAGCSVDQPDRIWSQHTATLEAKYAAAQRRGRQRDFDAAPRRHLRDICLLNVRASAVPHQLEPARETDAAVHPVHLRIARAAGMAERLC